MPGSSGRSEPSVSMSERLKRFQTRYEPMITRVVLLGVFCTGLLAQFVKPVGDAMAGKTFLGGALLSLVGYVLYDSLKDLTASLRLAPRAQVKSQDLGRFVTQAFESQRVEISFLGYTGETLYNELYHRLEAILASPGPIRQVRIRFLVPDFRLPMRVPSRVGPQANPVDDEEFRKGLESQCMGYARRLSALAHRLTNAGPVTAECEYRFYSGIPRDKICIFNRELVLHGLYDLAARTIESSSGPEYFDPKGYQTDLTFWSSDGTSEAKTALATWNKHFDDLWDLAERSHWHQGTSS
ncbi:hypothetical protein [Streptomyces sp. B1-3]|uniref:hypothetical protein n=1 Tax=Streptomyces sp. B1-3 TaxID=3141453 RepID=UPI003D2BE411